MADQSTAGRAGYFTTIPGRLIAIVLAITLVAVICVEGLVAVRMTENLLAPHEELAIESSRPPPAAGSASGDDPLQALAREKQGAADHGKLEAQAKCEQRFQSVMNAAPEGMTAAIASFKEVCSLTATQRDTLAAELARMRANKLADNAGTEAKPPPPVAVTAGSPQKTNNNAEKLTAAEASPTSAASTALTPDVSFKTFANADMYGGDIGIVRDVDLDACAAACRVDARCVAFSYDLWKRACYLKNTENEILTDVRSVTGVRGDAAAPRLSQKPLVFESFHNLAFHDASGPLSKVGSFQECEALCSQTQSCIAVTYFAKRNACQLLEKCGSTFASAGFESAAKHQYFEADKHE